MLIIVLVAAVVLVLVGAAVVMSRVRRTQHLRRQFGPEYERTLSERGSRREAERELEQRQERHGQLDIRPLRPDERQYYRSSWQQVQRGFVDDPGEAVRSADRLVVVIMRERGYPVDDFEQRAADISVAHPQVVAHYRQAREIADAHQAGHADTEDLRNAVTSYRSLVDALLEDGGSDRPGSDPAGTGPADSAAAEPQVREPGQHDERA